MSVLNTTLETVNGVVVVLPEGRLDYDAAAGFQSTLEQTLAGSDKPRGMIIDCTSLSYVSSAGLRSFLVGARAAKSAGVPFVVCSLSQSVREVFTVSGFSRIIEEHADRAAALAKLG
ncbi:MAG: STAS domain-containing protein [Gammaproteobacteria bacterium]|nr:STAS domain-containing protein [Gammaproteobacteria bacterium]